MPRGMARTKTSSVRPRGRGRGKKPAEQQGTSSSGGDEEVQPGAVKVKREKVEAAKSKASKKVTTDSVKDSVKDSEKQGDSPKSGGSNFQELKEREAVLEEAVEAALGQVLSDPEVTDDADSDQSDEGKNKTVRKVRFAEGDRQGEDTEEEERAEKDTPERHERDEDKDDDDTEEVDDSVRMPPPKKDW